MKTDLVSQGITGGLSLEGSLKIVASAADFDQLDVAVAYATKQGIRALELALGKFPETSRWVIGLDDAITQPEAIDYLIQLKGAEVRLAALAPGRRFHPKLYCLSSNGDSSLCVSAIGSGNMTLNGLRRNGETAALLHAENKSEADALKAQWAVMWSLGAAVTQAALDSYRDNYKQARAARKKIIDLGVAPIEPAADAAVPAVSTFTGLPATAGGAWTEGASPSAGGRDLEFPKKMMPFFGLNKTPSHKWIRMKPGERFLLTFTERTDNQMWRLLFSRESILAAIGRDSLRPFAGGNRSDLAIIFRKATGNADFDVEMVVIGSPEHVALIQQSKAINGLDRTRDPGGRYFGYL